MSLEAGVRDDPKLLSELRWAERRVVPRVISFCVGVTKVVREDGKDDREVWRSRQVLELAAVSTVGDLYGRAAAMLSAAAQKGGL